VRSTFERQHLGDWASAAFECRVRAEVLPGRHHVLGRDEDERAAEPFVP
jgi:hypothetical protein